LNPFVPEFKRPNRQLISGIDVHTADDSFATAAGSIRLDDARPVSDVTCGTCLAPFITDERRIHQRDGRAGLQRDLTAATVRKEQIF
jgi:hypothetical protein